MANDNDYTNSSKVYYPSERYKQESHISSLDEYRRLYKQSIENPGKFWRKLAVENFYWHREPSENNFLNYNFDPTKGSIFVEWMKGAKTNICYNAVDRIIEQGKGDKVAYIWEGNTPGEERQITYSELKIEVSKFANVLKSLGVQKGARVAIYMPVTIELVVAMLGCARIGAVHTVVFAGFSSEALADRMLDARCQVLVTSDGYYRGNKLIQLKEISAEALERCHERGHRIKTCIVHRRINLPVIVTGNGSIRNSHLPNGQALIRRQTTAQIQQQQQQANGTSNSASNGNGRSALATTQGLSLASHCISTTNINNNNISSPNHLSNINGARQAPALQPKIPLKAISWNYECDAWWDKLMAEASSECEPVWVDAEDPLFILYTR